LLHKKNQSFWCERKVDVEGAGDPVRFYEILNYVEFVLEDWPYRE